MPNAELTIQVPKAFDGGVIADAFHGTSAGNAASILKVGFHPSEKTHMFGPGVYFFEGDYRAAVWWAEHCGASGEEVSVVRAEVKLGRTLYVNLMRRSLGALSARLTERLKRKVTIGEAYKVLVAKLLRANVIDSIKAVRTNGNREYAPSLQAEIIVVVLDPKRAKPAEELKVGSLGSVGLFHF